MTPVKLTVKNSYSKYRYSIGVAVGPVGPVKTGTLLAYYIISLFFLSNCMLSNHSIMFL